MNKHFWGIKGWEPIWYDSADRFLLALEEFSIVGFKIDSVWTLYDENEWFEDAPVVVIVDGNQMEFCANKIGEFSLSKNTIDLNQPVAWCEEPTGVGELKWQKNLNQEFLTLINNKVTEVGYVEYCLDLGLQEIFQVEWTLSGVYFSFGVEHVEIFNALDCNGISANKNHTDGLRYKKVI